eukprot:TRINITY_DN8596_c0_g1_i2.p1 TRINITY_DN8596_c0_g1~~TRINITY_DN8596_c0_g1_i2.p1  ORF type:complete len:2097 (-),score=492.91 TRINITY_DN8596_c0_g1_i2:36-6326(-)
MTSVQRKGSSLSEQLLSLKNAQPIEQSSKRASLLFDPVTAANMALITVQNIGKEGLEELIVLDDRFQVFRNTLFNVSTAELQRDLQTAEENKRIDDSIRLFLRLSSPFFLLRSCHKALEWLIRKFRIYEGNNVQDVILCILPYHQTNLFARMIHILVINRGNIWEFLDGVKKNGNPLDSKTLLGKSFQNYQLLECIGDYVKEMIEEKQEFSTLLSFYASFFTQFVGNTPKTTTEFFTVTSEQIFNALATKKREMQTIAYMAISQMSAKSTLSSTLLYSLFKRIGKTATEASFADALLCLNFLCQSQKATSLPTSTILEFGSSEDFIHVLCQFSNKGYDLDAFLLVALKTLIDLSFESEANFAILQNLLANAPVEGVVCRFVSFFLQKQVESFKKKDFDKRKSEIVSKILRLCEKSHYRQLDQGIEEALKSFSDPKNPDSIQNESLLEFVEIVFKGTRHESIKAEKGQSTLFLSLEHHNPQIRLASLEKLENLAKRGSDKMFVEDSLVRRLNDEDKQVLEKTLKFPELEKLVNLDVLLPSLIRFIIDEENEYSESVKLNAFACSTRALENLLNEDSKSESNLKEKRTQLLASCLPHLFSSTKLTKKMLEYFSRSGNQLFHSVEENGSTEDVIRTIGNNIATQWKNASTLLRSLHDSHPKTRSVLYILLNSAFQQTQNDLTKIQIAEILLPPLKAMLASSISNKGIEKIDEISQSSISSQLLESFKHNHMENPKLLGVFILRSLISGLPKLAPFRDIFLEQKERNQSYRNFILITKLYSLFCQIDQVSGISLLQQFMKTYLSNPVDLVKFLTFFWTLFEGVPLIVKTTSIRLVHAFVDSFQGDVDFQLILPPLITAFFDDESTIRKESLNVLSAIERKMKREPSQIFGQKGYYINLDNKINTLKGSIVHSFVKSILAQKSEILASKNFAESFFDEYFQDSDGTGESIINYLIQAFINMEGEVGKRNLFGAIPHLTQNNLKHISSFFLVSIEKLMEKDQEGFASQSSDIQVDLLVCFAKRISPLNIGFFSATEKLLEELENVMSLNVSQLDNSVRKDQIVRFKISLFETLTTPETFKSMSLELQKRIFIQVCGLEQQPSIKEHLSSEIVSNLPLDISIVTSLLSSFYKKGSKEPVIGKKLKLSPQEEKDSEDKYLSVNLLLEQIPALHNLHDYASLCPHLFHLLKRFLNEDDSRTVSLALEYSVQLCLSSINSVVQKIQSSLANNKGKSEKEMSHGIEVDVLISTLRSSNSNQIHLNVLQCLTSLTSLVPKQITQQMMPIFTVMGSSISENYYSWTVVKRAIEQVIPSLVQHGTDPTRIISSFVTSFYNISIHRRVQLFQSLVIALDSISEKEYLTSILLSLLIREVQDAESNVIPKSEESVVEFGHSLLNLFKVTTRGSTLQQLLEAIVLSSRVASKEERTRFSQLDVAGLKELYKPESLSLSSHNELTRIVIEFLADHITSTVFLDDLLVTNAVTDQQNIQNSFLLLFQNTLQLIQHASDEAAKKSGEKEKWKNLLHISYQILDSLNELLAIPGFIICISKLLEHSDSLIRKRALVILNEKLESEKDSISPALANMFVEMTSKLIGIVNAKQDAELDYTKQSAILSLEILARNFGKSHQKQFAALIPSLIRGALNHPNIQVVSSAAICLASISSEVGSIAFPHLAQLIPIYISHLNTTESKDSSKKSGRSLLHLSILSSLEVVIVNLSKFMSPHLSSIIKAIVDPLLIQSQDKQIPIKIKEIFTAMASNVEARLLIAAILDVYKKVSSSANINSIVYLLQLLADVCGRLEADSIQTNSQTLFKFFLGLFDMTIKRQNDQIETAVIVAFMALVLKLNENLFRPFFASLVEWAQVSKGSPPNNAKEVNRSSFFFRIMDNLANKLKSIVVTYFGSALDHAIACLEYCKVEKRTSRSEIKGDSFFEEESNSSESGEDISENDGKVKLVKYILSSLRQCFLHDNEGFITKERFDKLHVSIVEQLDNMLGTEEDYEYRISQLLVPTITQLALCVGKDVLWKPLNHQVLLKTRSESAQVRYSSLRVLQELYTRLGEEVLVLVPETVPFISELMEDSNNKVEELVRNIVKLMEQQLGEDAVSSLL